MDKNKILAARGCSLRNDDSIIAINVVRVVRNTSPLDKLVFSPNKFGWPSSDIEFKEKSTNAEVRQALERRQMPIPSQKGEYDDDLVLDMIPKQSESLDDYADRLSGFVDDAKQEISKGSNE